MTTTQLATLLSEQRRFPPPPAFAERAAATQELYRQAKADRLRFWEEQARMLDWIAPWTKVLEWTPPHAKWYVGGKLNASVNCLDRHLAGPRRNKAALIWEGEPGDRRTLTYWELSREVNRAANALRRLGVKRGDRVAIYLPMIPEAAKWYLGGKLNASVNCLDRHLAGPRRNKTALIWEGEPGDRRTLPD